MPAHTARAPRPTLGRPVLSTPALPLAQTHIAGAVVNADNASLSSMSTDDVLDLFELSPSTTTAGADGVSAGQGGRAAAGAPQGLQSLLSNVGELWGEEEQEDDLDEFLDQIA